MKTIVQPVALKPEASAMPERHVVKTVALFTFRGLRSLIDAAKEVPDIRVSRIFRSPSSCVSSVE